MIKNQRKVKDALSPQDDGILKNGINKEGYYFKKYL